MRMKRTARTVPTQSLSAFANAGEHLPERAPIEIPADSKA
ncbi:hypothetical protein GGR25_001934 [Kaistia hirudinis]|uniref:Uncharacterized protein n=1 Tax=Kaistia hirudinis TaxID=1293440 RepID=A0A840AQY9_9HYPH|nr:hypothetical protein [Kaistia hirudinis]